MYEKEFQNFGLTNGEAKIYSYLLNSESSTVGPIVKNSKVAYSNIYEILERLIQKGLVSYIVKNKTRYYKALAPNRLKDYLKSQKNEIMKKENELNNLLPKLQKLTKKHETQSGEIYIGINGLLTAYENLLENSKKNEELLFFYSYKDESYQKTNDFYYQLFPKLKEKKILLKGIANINFKQKFKKEKPPTFLRAKFVEFPTPSNIDIFNNKILITTWEDEPIGILITSNEIADSFRDYFNTIWKIAKK